MASTGLQSFTPQYMGGLHPRAKQTVRAYLAFILYVISFAKRASCCSFSLQDVPFIIVCQPYPIRVVNGPVIEQRDFVYAGHGWCQGEGYIRVLVVAHKALSKEHWFIFILLAHSVCLMSEQIDWTSLGTCCTSRRVRRQTYVRRVDPFPFLFILAVTWYYLFLQLYWKVANFQKASAKMFPHIFPLELHSCFPVFVVRLRYSINYDYQNPHFLKALVTRLATQISSMACNCHTVVRCM